MKIKTITLTELETLWAEFIKSEPEAPIELTPSYWKFCKNNPQFWRSMEDKRNLQLQKLGLMETHQIDYYQNNQAPMWI